MKIRHISSIVALTLTLGASVIPARGASKEMIQLQTQVQALQDQMSRMQQSFDERMGVMNHLMEQNTDNMNKVSAAMTQLQNNMAKLQSDSSGKTDQISGQIQALNDSVDELKARVAKLSKQLEDMQAAQQSLAANQAAQQANSRRWRKPLRQTFSTRMHCAITTRETAGWLRRNSPTTSSSTAIPILLETPTSTWPRCSSAAPITPKQ